MIYNLENVTKQIEKLEEALEALRELQGWIGQQSYIQTALDTMEAALKNFYEKKDELEMFQEEITDGCHS